MNILIATLLSGRKPQDVSLGVPSLFKLPEYLDKTATIYIDIEADVNKAGYFAHELSKMDYENGVAFLSVSHPPETQSSIDQDPSRLPSICDARNRALGHAVSDQYEWLYFSDADVVPPAHTLSRLIQTAQENNLSYLGGLVPGRGDHRHATYVFGVKKEEGPLIYCDHGTCGSLLMHRRLFTQVKFHSGPHPDHPEVGLSEDPMLGVDAFKLGFGYWVVDTRVRCKHLGELKAAEAVNNYHNQ